MIFNTHQNLSCVPTFSAVRFTVNDLKSMHFCLVQVQEDVKEELFLS